jgi:hypothetical protein
MQIFLDFIAIALALFLLPALLPEKTKVANIAIGN